MTDVATRLAAWHRQLGVGLGRLSPGQTTVEWLMVAGLLTAMMTAIGAMVSREVLRYGINLIWSVRTIAP